MNTSNMSTDNSKSVNLKEIYFKHHSLTHINGKLTYNDIQAIYCQEKENTQEVTSNLGVGANGHFLLIISTTA